MTTKEMLLRNALTEMLREIERCPGDSIVDIANESLRSWETGLCVDQSYCVDEDLKCQD